MTTQVSPLIELDHLSEQYDIIGELGGGDSPERSGATKTLLGARKSDQAPVLITIAAEPEQDANNALSHLAADTNLLATMRHRALLPVLGGEWLGNSAFAIISERPSWPSLAATVAREQMPYARIAAVLREVNAVIEWARDKGIVHRGVDAESLFIEPQSDRTLVKFGATALPEHGTPGRASDAATIARLAKLMIGEREDAPRRLVTETDAVLASATERGATPDIHEYIALVAMADAVKQGEDHSAETAMALEQQRTEFDAKIAAERAEHERAMEEQRKAFEHKVEEQDKAHEQRLKELERRAQEHEKAFEDRIKELERQRKDMEKQHAARLKEVEKRHEQHEKQIASHKRDVERELERQRRTLERDRKRLTRDAERLGLAGSGMVAAVALPGAGVEQHDVEVHVPRADDSKRISDPEVMIADMPTLEMGRPLLDDDDLDEIVDQQEAPHPSDLMPLALDAATIGAADASVEDVAETPDSPDSAEAEAFVPPTAEREASDADSPSVPVPSIWDRPAKRSFWARLPRANTPVGMVALALLLFVMIGATVTVVRHNHERAAATSVAARLARPNVDSAAGTVAAPFGFFALPSADSLAKLRRDSLAADSASAAGAAAAAATASATSTEQPRRERPAAVVDTQRASDSTRVRNDSAIVNAASRDTSLHLPAFTIHPETTSTRLAPRDTAKKQADSVKPDTTVRRDTTA